MPDLPGTIHSSNPSNSFNFAKLTGKHPCQSLFSNKAAGCLRLYLKGFTTGFSRTSGNTFFPEKLRTIVSVMFMFTENRRLESNNNKMFTEQYKKS